MSDVTLNFTVDHHSRFLEFFIRIFSCNFQETSLKFYLDDVIQQTFFRWRHRKSKLPGNGCYFLFQLLSIVIAFCFELVYPGIVGSNFCEIIRIQSKVGIICVWQNLLLELIFRLLPHKFEVRVDFLAQCPKIGCLGETSWTLAILYWFCERPTWTHAIAHLSAFSAC